MRIITTLALAASLSACATSAGDATLRLQRTDAMLARVEAGYIAARSLAMVFTPWLPPAPAARLHLLGEAVEVALAAARRATDLATRRAALDRAEAATAAYRLASGG